MPVDHYENFPVASFLVPAPLRRPIEVIYRFARSADDIADEGDASAEERLAELAAYQAELDRIETGTAPQTPLFVALAEVIRQHALPIPLFRDLLDAFAQDVVRKRYADYPELLDYCRRSANPVGRLVLHLFGRTGPELQLINFWQDLSVDLPRGRFYLPATDCVAHGLDPRQPQSWPSHPRAAELVAAECRWARELMLRGAGVAHRVPGRAGWELRAVVQGGLRILDRIAARGYDSFHHRPRVGAADLPVIAWRCLRMRPAPAGPMGQSPA